MKNFSLLILCALTGLITPTRLPAAATCYALSSDSDNHLLTFQSDAPNPAVKPANYDQVITVPAGVELVGLAMRTTKQPGGANAGAGSLWALGNDSGVFRLYTVSTAGVATEVGGALTAMAGKPGGGGWGFAFNAGTDRFVAVNAGDNFEIDPNVLSGAATKRPAVFTDSTFPAFSGAAFTNVAFGQNSRFYITDSGAHRLDKSDDIHGGGLISFIGAENYGPAMLTGGQPNGLAIFADNKSGLLAHSNGSLYALTIPGGVATLVGAFPTGADIRSLVIKPTPVLPVTVKINKPKSTATTSGTIVLTGSATCQAGIKSVQYRVGSGAFKFVKGNLGKWKFTAALKPGANVISVKATGKNDAVSATQKIKITRKNP